MTVIKICGITNLEDALAAVDAGADALGFNFYRPSPRYITPKAASQIIKELPENILTVGVFVNEERPEIVESIAGEAGVTALQLHGDESPEFCAALNHCYVIKVLGMGADFDPARLVAYDVPAFMVDTFDRKARGGTGQTIDWAAAAALKSLVPKLFLAGGLSSENVGEAIATVQPYAVDACSALELRPGLKDSEKMRAFICAVHRVRSGG